MHAPDLVHPHDPALVAASTRTRPSAPRRRRRRRPRHARPGRGQGRRGVGPGPRARHPRAQRGPRARPPARRRPRRPAPPRAAGHLACWTSSGTPWSMTPTGSEPRGGSWSTPGGPRAPRGTGCPAGSRGPARRSGHGAAAARPVARPRDGWRPPPSSRRWTSPPCPWSTRAGTCRTRSWTARRPSWPTGPGPAWCVRAGRRARCPGSSSSGRPARRVGRPGGRGGGAGPRRARRAHVRRATSGAPGRGAGRRAAGGGRARRRWTRWRSGPPSTRTGSGCWGSVSEGGTLGTCRSVRGPGDPAARVAFTVLLSAPVVTPLERASWVLDRRLARAPVAVRAAAAALLERGRPVPAAGHGRAPGPLGRRCRATRCGARPTRRCPVRVAVDRFRGGTGDRDPVEVVGGAGHRVALASGWAERASDWVRRGYPEDPWCGVRSRRRRTGSRCCPGRAWPGDVRLDLGLVGPRGARRGRGAAARPGVEASVSTSRSG